MKIIVPIKRVPDPYGIIRLTGDGRIDESDIKWVVNPFDEIALEEAARIRERSGAVEIVAVTVGPQGWEEQLRTALAMGADRGIHVVDDKPSDPSIISVLLAAVCRSESPNIVLMGKQAIDDDSSQTGQMLAAHLGLPHVSFASKIEISASGDSATVTREIDSGRETLRVSFPAVITADLRLNEPRYVALPAIIKARSKPIIKIDAAELGARPSVRIRTLKLEVPAPRKPGRRVGSVQELITALREEASVI